MGKYKLKEVFEKIRKSFCGHFNGNDFGFVVYPFLKIFKIFGFMPINLDPNGFLNEKIRIEWDKWAICWSWLGSIIYVVGFIFGIHHISSTKRLEELHETMVIAYFTNWAQLLFLFLLGGYAVLNTWLNLQQLHGLLSWISQIDGQLEHVTGREVNYLQMRKSMFVQLIVVILVSASLSMANCVVIYLGPEFPNVMSTCFWFVCFFPILLLTLKEFQFYNLMFILKSKFDLINNEISRYIRRNPHFTMVKPLSDLEGLAKPQCSVETLKQLLQIYANLADCVELLLNIFAWHLLFLTTASFGVITIQGYNLFAALVAHKIAIDAYQLIVVICWIFVQIAVVGINVSACSKTEYTMSLTGTLLHRIGSESIGMSNLYTILQLFSMEVMQRKNCFTAAGFFNMDYKLITSIVAAVTTYLLIIIQFHTSMDKNSIPSRGW
ncbi:putative gustatory receptor 2a [Haematobia irritans]|uniref:putative gustatory receptor 2a n=1 Tax=Haematobia irritans TaxID=7368 RepID=UPI003F50025F